jgi:hypothetical protein
MLALAMGYEYGFVFSLPLQPPQLEELLHKLKTVHPWLLLSTAPAEASDVIRYAYAASGPLDWSEDFLVTVASQQVYLLLHTATADQTARVLTWLRQGAAELGLAGSVVEL